MKQRTWPGIRLWRFLKPLAPVILPLGMLFAALGGASVILTSCESSPAPTVSKPSLERPGVPLIRVRLTTSPVTEATLATTGAYRLRVGDGQPPLSQPNPLRPTRLQRDPETGEWLLAGQRLPGERLTLASQEETGLISFNGKAYRGNLTIHPAGTPGTFYVHNHVDMERYLVSVVAKELYSYFHPEAYRAQAIAARTYAMYEKTTRGKRGSFDVWDSQRSQVYGGANAETEKSRTAVQATRGWLLAFGPAGKEQVFLSQFSACNGGYVNGAEVLRTVKNPIPPLQGGQFDGEGKECPHYSWAPVQIRKTQLYQAAAARNSDVRKLKDIKEIRVKRATGFGRPIHYELLDSQGTPATVRADAIRLYCLRHKIPSAKKLYSMNCKVRDLGDRFEFYDGKGFGHGVGLSQWGAQARAKKGQPAEAILEFYYPGAKIYRAY